MVVQMCDFMNSQETRIAYLKWRESEERAHYLHLVHTHRASLLGTTPRKKRSLSERKKVVTRWHLWGRSEMYGEGLADGYRWGEDPWVALYKHTHMYALTISLAVTVPRLFGIRYTHIPIMPWVNKEDNNANEWHAQQKKEKKGKYIHNKNVERSLHACCGT